MASSAKYILYLCPEMLFEIFSYLNREDLCSVSAVCKQFYDLATNQKRLWEKFVFFIGHEWLSRHRDPAIAGAISRRGFGRVVVDVHSEKKLLRSIRLFPGLVSLGLFMWRLDKYNVISQLRKVDFSALKNLELYNLKSGDRFYKHKLRDIFPNLESLMISDWWPSCNLDLKVMLEGMGTLKKLTIGGYSSETLDGKCDSLELLVVRGYQCDGGYLRSIGRAFPNLRRLELYLVDYTGLNIPGDYLKYLPDVQVVTSSD